jgi:hypothetical protein
MDASPILARIAELFHRHGLEAVMVGNAAAALQGAPVTTVDIDFLFRKTPVNVKKLKAVNQDLGAVILRPFYPVLDLFRIMRDDDMLQIDFMTSMAGIQSYEGLRKRAARLNFGGHPLLVASLADIIKSKKIAGRPKDLAVMPALENALAQIQTQPQSETRAPQKRK